MGTRSTTPAKFKWLAPLLATVVAGTAAPSSAAARTEARPIAATADMGLIKAPKLKSWVIPRWGERRNLKQFQSPIGAATLPAAAQIGSTASRRNDVREYLPRVLGGMDQENHLDGAFIGEGRRLTSGRVPLSQVAGVVSKRAAPGPRIKIVNVNGVRTTSLAHAEAIELLADHFAEAGLNVEIVGLQNGTDGTIRDLTQTAQDIMTFGRGNNRAIGNLRDQILHAVEHDEQLKVLGHSQGAIIVSRALIEAKTALVVERGLTDAEAHEAVARHVRAVTYGGASACYIDPVLHVYNPKDAVASVFGAGLKRGVPSRSVGKVGRAFAPVVVGVRKLVRTEPLSPPGLNLGGLKYGDIYRRGEVMLVDSGSLNGPLATHKVESYVRSLTKEQTKEIIAHFMAAPAAR